MGVGTPIKMLSKTVRNIKTGACKEQSGRRPLIWCFVRALMQHEGKKCVFMKKTPRIGIGMGDMGDIGISV